MTGDPADFDAFDVPQLRGIARTAPYFHDNSAGTLEEVVDLYSRFIVRCWAYRRCTRARSPASPSCCRSSRSGTWWRSCASCDRLLRDRQCEPELADDLLVLSFDGKGIAMRHEDLREATRRAAAAEPKLHTRLAKGEKPNRKRMAQVAAVYSIARWQARPRNCDLPPTIGPSSSTSRSWGNCCTRRG